MRVQCTHNITIIRMWRFSATGAISLSGACKIRFPFRCVSYLCVQASVYISTRPLVNVCVYTRARGCCANLTYVLSVLHTYLIYAAAACVVMRRCVSWSVTSRVVCRVLSVSILSASNALAIYSITCSYSYQDQHSVNACAARKYVFFSI